GGGGGRLAGVPSHTDRHRQGQVLRRRPDQVAQRRRPRCAPAAGRGAHAAPRHGEHRRAEPRRRRPRPVVVVAQGCRLRGRRGHRRVRVPDSRPPALPLVKIGKQLVNTDESLNRLKGVIKKLDGINDSSGWLMQAAGLQLSWSGELSGHPPTPVGPATGSLLEDSEVFGRDVERKKMVSWLVAGSPPDRADPRAATIPVAVIIGLGGMGKTTLACVLLHDDLVKETFNLVMWVCPSVAYHKVGLLK
ncbi:hypothetical protein CFC21_002689, partial [Triticum aestivum]